MKNVEYRTNPFGWDLCAAGAYGCGSGNPAVFLLSKKRKQAKLSELEKMNLKDL